MSCRFWDWQNDPAEHWTSNFRFLSTKYLEINQQIQRSGSSRTIEPWSPEPWNHGFYRGIIPLWPNISGWWITTSSTAQGGGGSFKNRKPIGAVGGCESGMAERSHWWTGRCLRPPLFLSLSLTIYLCIYASMYLCIYVSIYLIYLSIYRSVYLSM